MIVGGNWRPRGRRGRDEEKCSDDGGGQHEGVAELDLVPCGGDGKRDRQT